MVNLRILSIQSNRLIKIEGFEALVNLEELYLSHNGIQKLEGLDTLAKLRMLDVSSNRIEHLENLAPLQALEEFWGNDNLLQQWKEVELLRELPLLNCVYFERNPLAKESGYRRKLMLTLPKLEQIDATSTKAST